jgi:hypothetical protein
MNRRDLLKAELALTVTVGSSLRNSSAVQAAEKPHRTDTKTLLIASHPYPEQSVMIKGLQQAGVFIPMRASALHCGMIYLPPLAFQAVTASELPQYQQQLIERLQN